MKKQNYTVCSLRPDPKQAAVLAQFVHYDWEPVLLHPCFVDGTSVSKGPLQLFYGDILGQNVETLGPQDSRPCFVSISSVKRFGDKGPCENGGCNRVD